MAIYDGVVVQHYRLTRLLGEGGFGAVYEAVHVDLGRLAAVKILDPSYTRHPEVVGRFYREAKLASGIKHDAVIDILDVGTLDTGEPYIMMEHVAGRSLHEKLEADGPLPLDQVRAIFEPLYQAVAAAHAREIVHRDLKPQNVMITPDGKVKLLDFGIAKLVEVGATAMTGTGVMMGTLQYMAPEQAGNARNVDVRADVYALAATLWAALVGRPPFDADSVAPLLLKVVSEVPPRVRSLRSDVPVALDAVIARCLAKEPSARPATVAEAWALIEAALDGRPAARPRARDPEPAAVGRRDLLIVAAVMSVAAVGIGAWVTTRGGPAQPSAAAPRPSAPPDAAVAQASPPDAAAPAVDAVVATKASVVKPDRTAKCGCPKLRLDCEGSYIVDGVFSVVCHVTNKGRDVACNPVLTMDHALEAAEQLERLVPGQGTNAISMMGMVATEGHTERIIEIWAVADGTCKPQRWSDALAVSPSAIDPQPSQPPATVRGVPGDHIGALQDAGAE